MAENKKSFVLYTDYKSLIDKLPDEIAGKLLKHIYAYVNDENPTTDDLMLNIAFEPIKMHLKRDLVKYENAKEDKSKNGAIGNLKRWNIDLYNKYIAKEISLEEAISIANNRKVSLPDSQQSLPIANIAVSVNDSVSVSDNVIKEKTSMYDFEKFWNDYDKKTDKKKTEQKYKSIKEEDRLKIKDYLPKYKIFKPDKQFRKDPYSFLHNQSWENEIVENKPNQPQTNYHKPKYTPPQEVPSHLKRVFNFENNDNE